MHQVLILICFLFSTQAYAGKRVVVVSWDGFRPAFLTSDKFKTPNARKLMKSGSYSLDLWPINPTLTYPNHTTMVTGVPSSVHGILSNTIFDFDKGPQTLWYWESAKIKAPPIWKKAYEEGKKVAILGWPVTVGGKATWLIPEIFKAPGSNKTNEELIRSASGAAALNEIETEIGLKIPTEDLPAHDQWLTKAALYLEKKNKPDLQLVHLSNVDHMQHETGVESKETSAAVEEMDRQIGELSALTKDPELCLIVLGDHGHADYKKVVNINVILKKHGMIQLGTKKELLSWKAIAHTGGSQAAIYLKTETDRKTVETILKKELNDGFNVLSRQEFNALHIYPDADFVVISKPGHSLSGGFKDGEIENLESPKSPHGYLGTTNEMKTVFLASGCGIKAKNIGKMSMLQVAPTIAKLLRLKLLSAHGKPVTLHE